MGVPEHIRKRQSAEVTLASGAVVGVTLPNARDLMFGGGMAWPVLERMAELEKSGETQELSEEDRAELYAFQRAQVAKMIDTWDGETIEADPDDLGWIDDAEFFELVAYFMRSKPLPGKAE